MAPKNAKIVIAVCFVIVAIVGAPWNLAESEGLDLVPASKSCGDFRVPAPGGDRTIGSVRDHIIKVEVVRGNVPCRVARFVMKDQWLDVAGASGNETGPWSCNGPLAPIWECEENGPDRKTIRGRFYCRDWGASRNVCLDELGPP